MELSKKNELNLAQMLKDNQCLGIEVYISHIKELMETDNLSLAAVLRKLCEADEAFRKVMRRANMLEKLQLEPKPK